MKYFAFYLPQFHEIAENNEWWGKGFTEWTNVRNAKPLYTGHVQPKHPLNSYYYNLLEKKTIQWQIELAKLYGIEGFIYYHYYFEGKLIMEKPAENFLKWKDLHHKFFFCWANHTWYKGSGTNRAILINQGYGNEDDWENHFRYLVPFFHDDRYEKKDNMPILMIYSSNFGQKRDMMNFFDKRCKEEGFDGLFVIETYTGDLSCKSINSFSKMLSFQTKSVFLREPSVSLSCFYRVHPITRLIHKISREKNIHLNKKGVCIIDGEKLYSILLRKGCFPFSNCKLARGICFEWDNTPRHGNKGYIITPPTKETFMHYRQMISKYDYVFINAWNEWAEGMMLEPTEESEYTYLKWLKETERK